MIFRFWLDFLNSTGLLKFCLPLKTNTDAQGADIQLSINVFWMNQGVMQDWPWEGATPGGGIGRRTPRYRRSMAKVESSRFSLSPTVLTHTHIHMNHVSAELVWRWTNGWDLLEVQWGAPIRRTFLQHRVDHLSVSHHLQISEQNRLKRCNLFFQLLSCLCWR